MRDACRALLDINVILDVLQRRQPFYDDSAAVLARIPLGVLERGAVDADGKLGLFHAVQHTTLLHGIKVYLRAARAVGWDAHYRMMADAARGGHGVRPAPG